MDTGHYNCRDYHVSPHFAATTITKQHNHSQLPRHESFHELEQRSRSPASLKPKFPLLKLPLELRQEIWSYLLPRTREVGDTNPLANHARNFSAVQKRVAKGMTPPKPQPVSTGTGASGGAMSNVVWQRGQVNLLCVCRQLHDECAEIMYSTNTFLLFLTFSGITFRYRWLLLSGAAPSRSYPFLELLPERYLRLIKRVVVHVDHVDSYTGMIKFNVSGKGLAHGLRRQVQRLVDALKLPIVSSPLANNDRTGLSEYQTYERRDLTKLIIRISNGNAVLDSIKSETTRKLEGGARVNEDLEMMLEPFRQLYGAREVSITGAVGDDYARQLRLSMERPEPSPSE
ncbi:hypothetical protein B0A50_03436 [Salinomyces thailandicus]|uniref:DUF7730 domain-containing protein n=1 Tax=Salinomyces thailandicus TaxID=706561 RepID=A0A4U0U2N5_9PEZI|nr:hypothetical protein B0A50_03436 [Salinomyces thailandica]